MSSPFLPSPTILVPHLPPKTFVGLDLISFTSTANFHGVKGLPNGWHFLYTGTTESFSLRCGGWFHVGAISAAHSNSRALLSTRGEALDKDIFIWKWDSDIEALVPLRGANDAELQEAMRYKANLGHLWQNGGLFQYRSRVTQSLSSARAAATQTADADEEYESEEDAQIDWRNLTDRLTPKLLSRIVGSPSTDLNGRPRWAVTSASSASRDADNIPGIEYGAEEKEQEFTFLPVDLKRTWREGAVGRERTEAAQDRSWALGDLIRRFSGTPPDVTKEDERWGELQIVGELQFAFLMALTIMNYSCLQQWKRLLELILTSRRAITEREPFMAEVIRLLLNQLKRCDDVEGGFFQTDGDGGGEFLRKLLTRFKTYLDEEVNGVESAVKTAMDELDAWVKEEYDWELRREAIVRRGMLQLEDGEQVEMDVADADADEESGEYAPLVVDLEDCS
ncbi:hypothetical protein ASPZODRAFT_132779 [Penicilliopsis zonata CBS 506.65]|uniref:Uncharacterized protein n=1 Tax=Penicilliopsis zonata CBS 506.65 TaxID=1073090 RepID=A0A1L9SHH9_9EURO|nr:hypothetical protein ASPZODRAFT_132779 [Penicilliopsis zonata CBS 506.65]OJJ46669.1 hypothetical protein ASPZODRAFT_132779 [Penicilliopsis zonata CBS 506.65]